MEECSQKEADVDKLKKRLDESKRGDISTHWNNFMNILLASSANFDDTIQLWANFEENLFSFDQDANNFESRIKKIKKIKDSDERSKELNVNLLKNISHSEPFLHRF